MRKVEVDFIRAVSLAIEEVGGLNEFSRLVGLDSGSVSKWISGHTKTIHPSTWTKIEPLVSPHLPSKEPQKRHSDWLSLPVFRKELLVQHNSLLIPIYDYAKKHSFVDIIYNTDNPTDFGVYVDDNEMTPSFTKGAVLILRYTDELKTNDKVLVTLKNGRVLFRIFGENDKYIYLVTNVMKNGGSYRFPKTNMGDVKSIYKVVGSIRNELTFWPELKKYGFEADIYAAMQTMDNKLENAVDEDEVGVVGFE